MSRADQIRRQQDRAFGKMADTIPETVLISGTEFTVPLAPGTTEQDTDDGVHIVPERFTFWLPKCDYPTRPAMRLRVTWNSVDYFVGEVEGEGQNHRNWKVTAARHRV